MSKVITFSRFFPAGHVRAGEPTNFVEKIASGLYSMFPLGVDAKFYNELGRIASSDWPDEVLRSYVSTKWEPKFHTIRAGRRFKPGDKFSPRVWSGKAYRTPQIIIAPDIEVKNTWDIVLRFRSGKCNARLSNGAVAYYEYPSLVNDIAKNDGLLLEDFASWFNPKNIELEFSGQIICWNEQIKY